MPTIESPTVSKAGIATSSSGERLIPASTRADGSVRKEIRVRPGYRPPEDVEVYKNRQTEAWKNRGKGGVPGAESLKEESDSAKINAAANKNAKRREARKKAAAAAQGEDVAGENDPDGAAAGAATTASEVPPPQPIDPDAEREKEAKKLTKKLRQARDLKEKKEKGDALLPEQFEKVIKISELIRQLETLGFDTDGNKKGES
ncbi:hypothetical protein P154DRAFT_287426 [Amniculicola lignicola CBS 123094]|uniref:WIBG Mago-binding domain-containing protein n=1 Tax=Amniculicola lignicola CBS 123094 TaxID=1392246 RepID=A0A6A5X2M6_9PLEO|nr:hypothetical protein P154DRAFT_287426 [Amniculicola lignicola CBS 123094]